LLATPANKAAFFCDDRETKFRQLLLTFYQSQTSGDQEKYIRCICKIAGAGYREIVDDATAIKVINYALSTPSAALQEACCQIILFRSQSGDCPELVNALLPVLARACKTNNTGSLKFILIAVKCQLKCTPLDQITALLPQLMGFCSHPNTDVRDHSIDLCIYLYDNHARDFESAVAEDLRVILLRGLSDTSLVIRDKVLRFWNHPERIPAPLFPRLQFCLTFLFDPNIEDRWLSYATRIIFDSLPQATHWKQPMFKHSLATREISNPNFEAMQIDTMWHGNAPSQKPLFATQDGDDEMSGAASEQHIRATQAPAWTQTQTVTQMLATQVFNPDHTRSMTFQSKHTRSKFEAPLSSFAAEGFESSQSGPARKSQQSRSGGATLFATGTGSHPTNFDALHRHQFDIQRSSSNLNVLIRRRDETQRYKAAYAQLHAETQDRDVQLMRKYRKGELPDIQIEHSDLLRPLLFLHMDPIISRLLFTRMFQVSTCRCCCV
jgi:DNA-dependent protein kinase catalytic subunit